MYGLPKDFDGNRLVGCSLTQICFGKFQMQLHFDRNVTISVESTLLYRDPAAQQAKKIGIPDLPRVQCEVLNLLHRKIMKAFGDPGGTLTMDFGDGYVLQCLDDQPGYEAYQLNIGNETIIV
jgi:hypothetical protein